MEEEGRIMVMKNSLGSGRKEGSYFTFFSVLCMTDIYKKKDYGSVWETTWRLFLEVQEERERERD